VGISSTVFNGGKYSLSATVRATSTAGPSYPLPLVAAKYNVTFHVYHTGVSSHTLSIQPTYTCLGGSLVQGAPINGTALAGATWETLTGTITLPPANAAAGCKLSQAEVHVQQEAGACGTIECPDLFIDDVSIVSATP